MTPNQSRGETVRSNILVALRAFNERGVTPTQYELARVLGYSQTSVSTHMRKLRASGRLDGLNAPGRAEDTPTTPAQASAIVRQWLAERAAHEPDTAVHAVLRELIRALDPAKRQIIMADRSASA